MLSINFLKKNFLKFIGVILFFYIISRADFNAIFQTYKKLNMLYLLPALVFIYILILVKGCKFYFLFAKKINFKKMYFLNARAIYFGLVTPGRVGELLRAEYLTQNNIDKFRSYAVVIIDRIFDVLVVSIASIIFFVFFKPQIWKTLISNLNIDNKSIIIILCVIFFLIFLMSIFFIFQKKDSIKKYLEFFFDLRFIFFNLFFSAVYIAVYAAQLFLIAKSMNIAISFLNFYFIINIMMFITMIPITFMGVGTRDATLIFLFSFFEITKTAALSFSLTILALYIINVILTFGFSIIDFD